MKLSTTAKAAKVAVKSKAARQLLKGKKNSPHILFAVGVVGIVGTAYLASKAGAKAEKTLDAAEPLTNLSKKEKAAVTADVIRIYTPTVLVGAVTIGCFTGSHYILHKRYTGVVAAYAVLDSAYKEYRKRVAEEVGEDRERELYYGTQQIEVTDADGKTTIKTLSAGRSEYSKFFGPNNLNYYEGNPQYSLIFLKAQQKYADDRLKANGFLMLNDVYKDLGFEPTTRGAVVGWVYGEDGRDNYVDFGIFDDEGNFRDFMSGEGGLWLDFNVDGVVYELIDKKTKNRD